MTDPLLVRFARYFACKEHGNQMYGGGLPYSHHLEAVDKTVQEFWNTWLEECWDAALGGVWDDHVTEQEQLVTMRAAAWLHDVVEDAGVSRTTVHELFGDVVGQLVHGVTNEAGANRKIRAALTYPKTRAHPAYTFLKLCDRIANVRHGRLVEMYRLEYEDFRRNLYVPKQNEVLWKELDRLMADPTA